MVRRPVGRSVMLTEIYTEHCGQIVGHSNAHAQTLGLSYSIGYRHQETGLLLGLSN